MKTCARIGKSKSKGSGSRMILDVSRKSDGLANRHVSCVLLATLLTSRPGQGTTAHSALCWGGTDVESFVLADRAHERRCGWGHSVRPPVASGETWSASSARQARSGTAGSSVLTAGFLRLTLARSVGQPLTLALMSSLGKTASSTGHSPGRFPCCVPPDR